MKKLFSVLFAVLAVTMFVASCSKDDPDYHTLRVNSYLAKTYPVQYYADQTHDSLFVVSTDSWESDTKCDWIRFRQTALSSISYKFRYQYGVALSKSELIVINANATGADRSTQITTSANGKQVVLSVVQHPYLNITNPQLNLVDKTKLFSKTLAKATLSTELAFTLYNDARLSTEDSWITLPSQTYYQGDFSGKSYTVTIQLEANTTGAQRNGKVTLTSETGVATVIEIVQNA